MERSKLDLLFATPIYTTLLDLGNELKLIQSKLENFEYYNYSYSEYTFGTVNQKILNEPIFKNIKEKIENHLDHYLFNVLKFKPFDITHASSWLNRIAPKGYAQTHYHSFSVFSGVLYLDIPNEDSGGIKFYADNNNIFTRSFSYDVYEDTVLNSTEYTYMPENGMLIIFPSFLRHSVNENNSNGNRYSLAFNYFIDGDNGHKTQKLNLKVL